MSYPTTTKAVVLPAYNKNLIRALLSLEIQEVDLPKITDNEVIVKVMATPCNPSDIAFLQGGYNIVKPLPAIPGFEAMGEVVAVGENHTGLLNKRVSVFLQDEKIGCWSEYIAVSGENCLLLKPEINWQQAATLSINPITALGMFEIAKERKSSTIILNAAGGQVPEFVRAMAKGKGIEIINIFRKRSSAETWPSVENQINLFSNEEDFEQKLQFICQGKSNITALDAVGGIQSGLLFNALPKDSIQVVYGGLSNAAIEGVDTLSLIFNNKSIIGFNLNNYVSDLKKTGSLQEVADQLQDMIISEEFKTKINGVFSLEDVVKGIKVYIKNMSGGKVIFTP